MEKVRYSHLLTSILSFVLVHTTHAVTITWTGGAGTNSWHTPANWDLNRAPGVGDDVVIPDMTPNVTVTYSSASTSINSLSGVEAFTLSGGTLTIDATSALNSSFTLSGGTLTGAGNVTVNGAMTWSGTGTMSGTGKTIIASSGSLNVNDTSTKTLSRRLENHSPNANWNVTVNSFNNGTLSNESDGTMNFAGGFTLNTGGGTNAITNAGILNRTGVGSTTNFSIPFNNSGTVNVDSGTLNIAGGGTNTGIIDADAGTTLQFSASYTHDNASSLTGSGTLTFTTGTHNIAGTLSTNRIINLAGNINFNAPYTFSGTLNMGANLGGSGDLTITGTMNWTSGPSSMSGTGKTIIANSGSLSVGGGFLITLSRTLENHSANAVWTSTNNQFNNGTLRNESDGTFNLAGAFQLTGAGGTNTIINAGIMNKTGAGTVTVGSLAGVTFNNSGTVNVDAGGLTINFGGSNSGIIDADAGTSLTIASPFTHDNASSLIGTGTLALAGSTPQNIACTLSTNRIINIQTTVNFNAPYTFSGTLNMNGPLGGSADITITGALNWNGVTTMSGAGKTIIAPTGVLTMTAAGQKVLNRRLENHSPNATWTGGFDQLQLNNGTLSNEADGIFTINLGSSNSTVFGNSGTNAINNAGIFRKSGTGTLSVNTQGVPVSFSNSGTINAQAGILSITTLTNFAGTTLTGGTYDVSGSLRVGGANIVTNAASIILDGSASAIQNTSGADALANFATNSAVGSFQIKNGRTFTRSGPFNNLGQVQIGPGGASFNASGNYVQTSGTTTLDGGTLDPTDLVDIQSGVLSGNGTVLASVTNNGTISVPSGTLVITALNNQSGTTLTNGIYNVVGVLRYGNASIGNNAANIILDGPASSIENTTAVNALADFGANLAAGSFQLKNGRNYSRIGAFANSGQMIIGPGTCSLSASGNYVQSSGATTLDGGTLDPTDLADIQGGELRGNGSILASVTNSGTCKPGLSPGSFSISGDYTQTSSGTLEAEIGGTSAVAQYDQLAVSGRVILLGTLRILLINGFNPTIGNAFDVVTGNPISTKFTSIALPTLLALKGFQLEELGTSLRLNVIDCGPGDADGDGVGDACDTAPDLSWYTIDGGGRTFSSGGQFRIGATIGQPDAGSFTAPLTGGGFTLISGFWPGTAVPTCSLVGDMNLDTKRDGLDVQEFVKCILGTGSDCNCADMDDNGTVNNADIPPFVQILLN